MLGCGRPRFSRFYCQRHQRFLRVYGDVNHQPADAEPGARLRWLLSHVGDPTATNDPCVLWPFPLSGGRYGQVVVAGKITSAHVHILTLRVGPPPLDRPFACHGPCHNTRCMVHLSWGSPKTNAADRQRDGTNQAAKGEAHGHAKLTEGSVRLARQRASAGERVSDLAREYEVARETMARAVAGATWRWLT